MRLTNTITLRAHSKDPEEHERLKVRVRTHYGDRVIIEEETLKQDALRQNVYDDIHTLTAKLYHQPNQKAFLHDLKLFMDNKEELLEEAVRHLDERHSFFFRIDKDSFFTESWKFVHAGDVIQVRINVCAHPKTKENAMQCVREILA